MVLLSLALSATLLAAPQDPPRQDPPASALPDITVEGRRRTEETANQFVRNVAAPPFGTRGLAVWDGPICVQVDNLRPELAREIERRVADGARSIGVGVAAPGCTPNVVIVATEDGAATADSLVETNPRAFQPAREMTQLDWTALRRFKRSEDPVRWWTVSAPIDIETGQRMVAAVGERGPVTRHLPGMDNVPPGGASRGDIRQVMQWVIIVVDARKTADTPVPALAEYITMVSLAQIDPSGDLQRQPTILNLFSATSPVREMTSWDRAYLDALYASKADWSHVRFQMQDLARRMAQASPGDPPAP